MRLMVVAAISAAMPVAAVAAGDEVSTSVWAPPPAVDPASVPMPDIAFTPNASDVSGYTKYYVFHRADTDFATAYADLDECDNYAAGRAVGVAGSNIYSTALMSQFGMAGGLVGGIIAGAIADAQIAAERRKLRRGIMTTCMGYKGYARFGLPKELWSKFNFEEGAKQFPEENRMHHLRMQAKIASGTRPTVGEIK